MIMVVDTKKLIQGLKEPETKSRKKVTGDGEAIAVDAEGGSSCSS